MPYDGIVTKSITLELNKFIINGKINKIFQPNKNEIILGIYNSGINYALNCCISSDNYRINLTTNSKPNPLNAPGFCMLLRKHLIGSKIIKIYTPGLERIVIIELESYNEMNDLIHKKLIIELMGKHSNIILLNENNIIIDSLRHLDSFSNSLRDILPAHPYEIPATTKIDFLNIKNFEEFYDITNNLENLDIDISNTFNGISRLFMQNIIEELNIENIVNKNNLEKIFNYLNDILNNDVQFINYKNDYTTTLLNHNTVDSNKEIDITTPYLNFFIDDYYNQKEKDLDFTNYRNNVLKLVSGTLKKIMKKLKNIDTKLKECEEKDMFQLYGELITANLYKLKNIETNTITLENYYNNNSLIEIPVDKNISASINAKNYYKKYNKLKNALEIVNKQKIETIEELNYIETIIYSLENAKTINDIDEIYSEIQENELFFSKKSNTSSTLNHKPIKSIKTKNTNKKLDKEYIPIEYKIDNYTFLIGKNNKQNDYLSTKTLKNNDLWFHTKDIHSSHGILQTNNTEPNIDVIIRCAQIIAYYSKARQSSNVPVDYTLGQYVKKPSGSKPGMVIYTHNSTVNFNPMQ